MNTDEMLELLAADRTTAPRPVRTLLMAVLPAAGIALLVFFIWVGIRHDLSDVASTLRFDFKVLVTLTLGVAASGVVLRLASPEGQAGVWRAVLYVVPLIVVAGVVSEFLTLPRGQWWEAARGQNATWCLRIIPALALAPLLAVLWMLRQAAPARPAVAGAAAGLMSAGFASALYALHCTDDSPLFVALWYLLAIALVTGLGALLGSRWLRW